jgi:hypothetical protein
MAAGDELDPDLARSWGAERAFEAPAHMPAHEVHLFNAKVVGIERFRPGGMPEDPAPGESVGLLLRGPEYDDLRARLDAGELLFVRARR